MTHDDHIMWDKIAASGSQLTQMSVNQADRDYIRESNFTHLTALLNPTHDTLESSPYPALQGGDTESKHILVCDSLCYD